MSDNRDLNTVVLSKATYDSVTGENMRCRMLLDSIMNNLRFESEESERVVADLDKVMATIEVCYPNALKEKVSKLKRKRTIKCEKQMYGK